jgi:HAD superfamily hydrolase (TIGR01509 family)
MMTSYTAVIRAVLFDFDGTLTEPGTLDFDRVRKELGCSAGQPVLEFISKLPSKEAQDAHHRLDRFEMEAAARSRPNRGAQGLIEYLRSTALPFGIVSRNSRRSILRALQNFDFLFPSQLDVLISRDDNVAVKPAPEPILFAAERLGIPAAQILSVGDFIFDIEAAKQAGSVAVFLSNGKEPPDFSEPPDYLIEGLEDLECIIRHLRPLPCGKLPNPMLREVLGKIPRSDPRLIVGPEVGEDYAAVKLEPKDEVLVLKSDPVTFATSRIGYFAAVVNANDIATSGAVPRWLLATLLFPEIGTNAASIQQTIVELHEACSRFGIQLCGGHTEITTAVNQAVVVAQLIGTVTRERLVEKRGTSPGDRILLTKAIAVEGTAIIAQEFPEKLRKLGLSDKEIAGAQSLLDDPGISVLEEAKVAAGYEDVTAMHDVTEGGLATALEELSSATRHRIQIDPGTIPVLAETRKICDALGLDPLGLIGSGSLIIVCRAASCGAIARELKKSGISVSTVGEVLDAGYGVEFCSSASEVPAGSSFETDEITRAFQVLREL